MAIWVEETQQFLCECGCEEEVVNPLSSYKRGHSTKTAEDKERISKTLMETHGNDPTIGRRISKIMKKYWADPDYRERQSEAIREAFRNDPTIVERQSKSLRRRWEDPVYHERMSEIAMSRCVDLAFPERMSATMTKTYEDLALRRKVSEGCKKFWVNLSPEGKNEQLRRIFGGSNKKPNQIESLLDEFLREDYPGEWKYVGDGRVIIGGRIPDFMNANGWKAVIESFGTIYHAVDEFMGGKRSVKNTIEHYKEYGYDCLVVWVDTPGQLVKKYSTTIKPWIERARQR